MVCKLCINKQSNASVDPNANAAVDAMNNSTDGTLVITDTKLYMAVVTLLTQDDNKLLQKLKTGFKRTIKWNK